MSYDLKFRQENQGYGPQYFIIGSSCSKGSEKGPETSEIRICPEGRIKAL